MTVIIHTLAAPRWSILPEAACLAVVRGESVTDSRLTDLVSRCRGLPGFGGRLSLAGFARGGGKTADRPLEVWLAVAPDGRTAGAAALSARGGGPRWSIPCVLVAPESRGRGVGTTLVRCVLRVAAMSGADTVAVETLSSWSESTAFWSRLVSRLADGMPPPRITAATDRPA